ncbi:MAG: PQQ-binding-like beta-propeller repeat protein [Pirellulaceae bacterium]
MHTTIFASRKTPFLRSCRSLGLGLLVALLLIPLEVTPAQDWPGILGPTQDGQAKSTQLKTESWPSELKPNWEVGLGSGFAGAAIVGEKILVPHRVGNQEMLQALDSKNGRSLWKVSWAASYRGTVNPDSGPRCVPAVKDNLAVCYGAAGDAVCVDINQGKIIWQRPLRKEFQARDGYFGAGSSPIIVSDKAVICVGGKAGGIVALNLADGKDAWTATDYEASYASPIITNSNAPNESPKLLCVMRYNTVLIDSSNGKVLGEVPFGRRGPTVNAATPIAIDDSQKSFFLTASYGIGSVLLDIDGGKLTSRYQDRRLMRSQYNTPIRIGDRMIGIDGREDTGDASLAAFDPVKQTTIWKTPVDFGTSHLIATENSALALTLQGQLVVFDPQAEEYTELGRSLLPEGLYRSLPAISGNQLYLRVSDGLEESRLLRFDLPKP